MLRLLKPLSAIVTLAALACWPPACTNGPTIRVVHALRILEALYSLDVYVKSRGDQQHFARVRRGLSESAAFRPVQYAGVNVRQRSDRSV